MDFQDDQQYVGLPEGIFPARFQGELTAFIQGLYTRMTDEERAALEAYEAQYHVGTYTAELTVRHWWGGVKTIIRFSHSNLRKVAHVRALLSGLRGKL